MEMVDETTAFESDRAWIDSHIGVLVENFANHWIAVKGGQVVDKLVGAQPKANFVKKIEQHK